METKLKEFENICKTESENDKMQLEKEFDEKLKTAIEKEISEYKNSLENKFKNEKIELEKEYYTQKVQHEINSKKNIYLEIENEKKELFNILKDKLTNYCQSKDYENNFEKIYKFAKTYLDNENDFTVCVLERDVEKLKKIENCNIEILPNKYIGGILIKSKTKIVDNTIYTNLKARIFATNENN